MPKNPKKSRENRKKHNRAYNSNQITCEIEITFTDNTSVSDCGVSTSRGCAEPDGYGKAMANLKKGSRRKEISEIRSQQNQWPCQDCKAFFEGKNATIQIEVDPRDGHDNQIYFQHWVEAGIIPDDRSPDEPLVLRYDGENWVCGVINTN